MTDERLAELRSDLQTASAKQVELKRAREDAHTRVRQLAAEVQRINAARKELDVPYRNATERVADLTALIHAEEQRRAQEAEEKRLAEKAAAEASQAT